VDFGVLDDLGVVDFDMFGDWVVWYDFGW